MNTVDHRRRIIATALLSGSFAAAGLGLTASSAQAEPGLVPQFHGPIATDNFTVGHDWCPGQPLPMGDVWPHPATGLVHVAIGKPGLIQSIDPRSGASSEIATAPGAHTTAFAPPDRLYVFAPSHGAALILADA